MVNIGIIGDGECSPEVARIAEEVGELIAKRGAVLVCGGLGGVMEASAKGAKRLGGLTVGILPGFLASDANPFIDIRIVTGISHARNVIIVRSSDAIIAVGGAYGTLSEIALALKIGKPIIGLRSWEIDPNIITACKAQEAVEKAFQAIS